jgi:hypothetical protein
MASEDDAARERRLTLAVPPLGAILARALARDPADRFQSAREFEQALAASSFDEPEAAQPAAPASTANTAGQPVASGKARASRTSRRIVTAFLGIALACLLVLVANQTRRTAARSRSDSAEITRVREALLPAAPERAPVEPAPSTEKTTAEKAEPKPDVGGPPENVRDRREGAASKKTSGNATLERATPAGEGAGLQIDDFFEESD